jgi:hypothetical protein
MILFGRRTGTHFSFLSMACFNSLLRASLVVFLVVACILCSSNAATQYVNGATFFGRCSNFSIQAGTAVSFNGAQTNVTIGNVGVSAGVSISGSRQLSAGYAEQPNTDAAKNCAADELTAYGNLKNLTCTTLLASADLSGVTLLPGVYCTSSGAFTISAAELTLNGNGDSNSQFIFQTATTITTATATSFNLVNGTQANNVYWQIGSSATLGPTSSFVGHILAAVTINVGHTTTVCGRLLAQAAVNFEGGDSTGYSS